MDPGTGNIYTEDEATSLHLRFSELIPLEDDEAVLLLRQRQNQATKLKNRKKNKAARQARKNNR